MVTIGDQHTGTNQKVPKLERDQASGPPGQATRTTTKVDSVDVTIDK
jgi:hypothetical protein